MTCSIGKQVTTCLPMVDTAGLQRNRATLEHLENGSEARNVERGLQVQLDEDRGSSTRQ